MVKQRKTSNPTRQSPRVIENTLNGDMGCSANEKDRRAFIRAEIVNHCINNTAWTKASDRLKCYIDRATFTRYKRAVKQADNNPEALTFVIGRPADVPLQGYVTIGKRSCAANAVGHGLSQLDVKTILQPMMKKALTTKRLKVFAKKLQKRARIALRAADSHTAAQRKEDNDCRNPVRHAAGYKAIITLDDGKLIAPWGRSNFDFTGVGVTICSKNDLKVFHPMDSVLPASREQSGSELKTNMKLFSASNDAGQSMEQLYVFKHDQLEESEVVTVTFAAIGSDCRDVHALFTGGQLTGAAVVRTALKNHYLPWLGRIDTIKVSFQDRDPGQYAVLKELSMEITARGIRLGSWNASQTKNEQDEDAGGPFKTFKSKINSIEAEEFRQNNPELAHVVEQALNEHPRLRFVTANRTVIVATIVRAQYAHPLCFTSQARLTQRRICGHHPFDVGVIFDRHPGMCTADPTERAHCKAEIPRLAEVFGLKGFFDEIDLDQHKIPETSEQGAKRAKGQPVKSELLAEWRHGFSWDNHENTTRVRQERRDRETAERAQADEKKEAKERAEAADQKKLQQYRKRKATSSASLSAALKEKYRCVDGQDEQCQKCTGYFSTWAWLDLDNGSRCWKTPTKAEGEKEVWYCGEKACAQACKEADQQARGVLPGSCRRKRKLRRKQTPHPKRHPTKPPKKSEEPIERGRNLGFRPLCEKGSCSRARDKTLWLNNMT